MWNDDVRYYDVQDKNGEIVARASIAIPCARGQAWRRLDGRVPSAVSRCRPLPLSDRLSDLQLPRPRPRHPRPAGAWRCRHVAPHEFGHVLHHLLTEVDLPSIVAFRASSGTRGAAQPVHGEFRLGPRHADRVVGACRDGRAVARRAVSPRSWHGASRRGCSLLPRSSSRPSTCGSIVITTRAGGRVMRAETAFVTRWR